MSEIKCSILEMKAVFELLLENPTMSARTACARHGVRYRSFLKRTRQPEHEAHYIRTREFQQTLALEDMDDRFPESGASMKALKAFKKEAYKLDYQLKKLKPRRLMSRKPVDPLKQQMRDAQRRAKTHAPTPQRPGSLSYQEPGDATAVPDAEPAAEAAEPISVFWREMD
jgi:hypothetical protein